MVSSNQIKKNLGQNIRVLRESKNISREKLGEYVDLELNSISSIETGRTFISAESLASFSNYFNIEPSILFKMKPFEQFTQGTDIKREINRLLADCSYDKLLDIYNIIAVLKK